MDLQSLNDQLNDAVNRWIAAGQAYFSDLSQQEVYGWSAFGVGFVCFVVGLFLL